MPELPEVEVTVRYVREHVLHKRIVHIDTLLERIWRNVKPNEASHSITHKTITDVRRRGKYAIFELDDRHIIVMQQKMTGRIFYHDSEDVAEVYSPSSYDRVLFHLQDGSLIAYNDVRTLGGIYYFDSYESIDIPGLVTMGIEPLGKEFTVDALYHLLQSTTTVVKNFLLNQKYIAGIGNIYADEALFKSSIHPLTRANEVTRAQAKRLHKVIPELLHKSIEVGGTTFRDFLNGAGEAGHFRDYLHVYGRSGQPCHICKTTVVSERVGGRTTAYCPRCQKKRSR